MKTLNDFLETIPNLTHREKLNDIIEWILKTFPSLKCEIKWNQPMLIDHGTFILAFSASKNHFSVAPEYVGIQTFSQAIKDAGYDHSMMLFRIKWNQEVNYQLLGDIIRYNMKEKANMTSFWR